MTDDDGLPSEEQLQRIQRGVMRRIDLRRVMARRIAGGAAAVLLVGGGIGLLSSVRFAGSGASSGSAAGGSEAAAAESGVVVRCSVGVGDDDAKHPTVRVPKVRLPAAALDACAASVEFQSGSGRLSSASPAPAKSPVTGQTAAGTALVLCIDVDGTYTVLPRHGTATATCTKAGMEPYTR